MSDNNFQPPQQPGVTPPPPYQQPGQPTPQANPYSQPAANPYSSVPGFVPAPVNQVSAQQPFPEHPAMDTPAASGSKATRNTLLIVGGSLLGVIVLVVGLFVSGVLRPAEDATVTLPTPTPVETQTTAPATEEPTEEPEQPSDDEDIEIDASLSPEEAKELLDAMFTSYADGFENGPVWDKIERTERNQVAVRAFLYILADYRAALVWGIDAAPEYYARALLVEEKLLNEEPLGTTIKITLSDGRVFEYDGETGDGGYTNP